MQWIGHSDLRAMAGSLPLAKKQQMPEYITADAGSDGDLGPTKTLLSKESFDEIYLLSNYDRKWNRPQEIRKHY